MKIIKNTGKLLLTATAFLYAACLLNGITFFDYTMTADGGTLSVIGHSVDITSTAASVFWETYTRAEREAAELLPTQARAIISWISDIIEDVTKP